MSTQIRPSQQYTEKSVHYKVKQSTGIFFQEKKELKTNFVFSIYQHKRKDKSLIWVVDRTYDSSYPTENTYLDVIHDLEYYSYPIAVEVDFNGNLLNMVNHEGWFNQLKKSTEKFVTVSDNAADLRKQYLEIAENENKFFKNKTKEPFWNLLFFSPLGYKEGIESEDTIQWHIKTIGQVICKGKVKYNITDKGLKITFIAENFVSEEILKVITEKYQRTSSNYKIQLLITMEYHSQKYHYIKKTAGFNLYDNDFLLFEEKITIDQE